MTSDTPVTIDSVAFGGRGIARVGGKVLFVQDTVPGDIVTLNVTEDKGRYGSGAVTSFVTKSPLRHPSLCEHSAICGGCQWMEIAYDKQLEWKRGFVTSALQRIGKIPADMPIEIEPSEERLHYRNRVHLKGRLNADGSTEIGYFQAASRSLVAIKSCGISHPSINQVIALVREYRAGTPSTECLDFKLELQQLPTQTGHGPDVIATLFEGLAKDRAPYLGLLAYLKLQTQLAWVGFSTERDRAQPLPFEEHSTLTLHGLPGQFQQVNTAANKKLRAYVASLVDALRPKRLLDVFCGSGNLSLEHASESCYVEGVENNPVAIFVAKYNVEKNQISNAQYLRGDGERHLWKCSKRGETFDLVILDPPREGMYQGLIPLKNMGPRHVIYVSCDPATLARDIGALCRSQYRVASVRVFDFFPNTFHVESVVLLERTSESGDL